MRIRMGERFKKAASASEWVDIDTRYPFCFCSAYFVTVRIIVNNCQQGFQGQDV